MGGRRRTRVLRDAWEAFLSTGTIAPTLRPVVVDSWQRSLASGLDAQSVLPPVDLMDDELESYRQAHPLAAVLPIVRGLLLDPALDARHLVAVTDADGRLLWVEGDPALRSRAAGMHFVEGARWCERYAGTNAPGTSLALDQPVRIGGGEHFGRIVQPWSCVAAPIHDPVTGRQIGALDLTGGDHVDSPHGFALVRATVAAVEAELRLLASTRETSGRRGTAPAGRTPPGRLDVLGHRHPVLRLGARTIELRPRFAEILVLLRAHPDGVSAERLASELRDGEAGAVAVRVEVSRLRALLGPSAVTSRPYALTIDLTSDLDQVRGLLRRGAVGAALAHYPGPLLPDSDAPGIRALRDELADELRSAVRASGDPDLLLAYANAPFGLEDVPMWSAVARALPAGSPHRAGVQAHRRRLDREFGVGAAV